MMRSFVFRRISGGRIIIIAGMAAGLIAAVAPQFGLVGAGILTALLLAFYGVFNLPGWVFFLLISKPLINLARRWRFIEIADCGIYKHCLAEYNHRTDELSHGCLVPVRTGIGSQHAVLLFLRRILLMGNEGVLL